MAWAIITIYISKCAQMNPQQLPITSKFYSRCKKCDIEKTLGGYHPLGSPKAKRQQNFSAGYLLIGRATVCVSHMVEFELTTYLTQFYMVNLGNDIFVSFDI